MDKLVYFAIFLVFCGFAAYFAQTRGKNAVLWFVIAFLISPLLAFILILVLPDESASPRIGARGLLRKGRRALRRGGSAIASGTGVRAMPARVPSGARLATASGGFSAPPPRPTPLPEEGWFVGVGGKQMGPLTLRNLQAMVSSGSLNGNALVWRQGYSDWVTLKTEPQLKNAIGA